MGVVAAVLFVGVSASGAAGLGGFRSTDTTGPGEHAVWMHDLAAHLSGRKLSEIVIPGSHDAGTYSFGQSQVDAITQSEDLIHQLNDGARAFDIRVRATKGGYYLFHGREVSSWLQLSRVFTDISDWAINKPGSDAAGDGPRDQEVILVDLTISGKVPTADCQSLEQQLGDALVTPAMLQANFGTTDPGQVTLGQLWSLPDSKKAARVILNNSKCLDAAVPSAGRWNPNPPFGQGKDQSYYANQCSASGIENEPSDPPTQGIGVWPRVSSAVKARRIDGNGIGPPTPFGPSMVGGVYTLFIQGTGELSDVCSKSPKEMLPDEKTVLSRLVGQWRKDSNTRKNLNVVSGDFFQETNLVKDVIAMDRSWPRSP